MLRQVIQCKQKKHGPRGAHPLPIWQMEFPCHVRIIFFLMAYKASLLSKFTSMQDLENNIWIVLDPLGNIYEIYANLTAMTLLNPNHF